MDKKIWLRRFKDHLTLKEIAIEFDMSIAEVEYRCKPNSYKGGVLLDKFLADNNLSRKIPRRQFNYEVIWKMYFVAGMRVVDIVKEIGKSRQYIEQVIRGTCLQHREELRAWKEKNNVKETI